MSSGIVAVVALLMAMACKDSQALTCYETDSEGHHVPKTDPTWKYCAYAPKLDRERGLVVDSAFGLSEESDSLTGYDYLFAAKEEGYAIVDTCIHEKVDLRGWSPRFTQVEHTFRCVCNYDLCNKDSLFGGYFGEPR